MMTTNDSNAETHHEFDDDGAAAFWLHVCNVILVKLIHYKPIKETEKRWPNEFFFLHFSSSFPFSTSPWQIEIVSLRKKEKKKRLAWKRFPSGSSLQLIYPSIHNADTQMQYCLLLLPLLLVLQLPCVHSGHNTKFSLKRETFRLISHHENNNLWN